MKGMSLTFYKILYVFSLIQNNVNQLFFFMYDQSRGEFL